ncbi:phosphotransferase family protein [Pseudonocardia sp. NPDC049154]|uniref:phosphotransferase family protein n=1 Tax=Pseudonocardia sp. NPDC049154 TaxID=3155501 RepID=UPI0033F03827
MTTTSTLAGLDAPAVEAWLAGQVEGFASPARFTLVAGGRSNLTYRIDDAAGHAYALRRPPLGGVLSTAHDMSREWRFVSAMAPTAVPVAPPRAYCADLAVTGAEFYVMDFVEGTVLADPAAAEFLAPAARARAGEHVVEVLAALHALDPAEVGLEGSRKGYAERQLARWHQQIRNSGVEGAELALLDEIHAALAAHVPPQSRGIVHGDFRPGNMTFGPDGTVRAVFDWELSTLGDPMADLGYLVSLWQEPGDELPEGADPGPTTVPGFPTRDELVDRYARTTGRDVSNLPYWIAFNRWRSACILAGVQARYLAGVMADDGYADQVRARVATGRLLGESAKEALVAAGLG